MCNPQDTSHRASALLQVGQTGFISAGRLVKMIALWRRYKPILSSENKILSLSFITMQEFSQIPAPVAVYCLSSILSVNLAIVSCIFIQGGKRICSRCRTLICKASLFEQTKEATIPPLLVLLISHIMMTLVTPCILPSSTTI